MRVLELFSGTGSVGNVCRRLDCDVTSLDRDMPADIRTDILDWNYTLPPNSFDAIWASPPCTEYSVAKTVGLRKMDEANAVVQRTIEIIRYFNPTYWMMENPQTGLLKHQLFMADLPYNDLDYCKTACRTGSEPGYGTTLRLGHRGPYVRRTVDTWLGNAMSSPPNKALRCILPPLGRGSGQGICTRCLSL